MEINQEEYAKIEFQTANVFQQAGWNVELVTDYERIDTVVDKALLQNVVKDTTSFIFVGFGAALSGMSSAFFGSSMNLKNVDYKA